MTSDQTPPDAPAGGALRCPSCGAAVASHAAQALVGGELWWSRSYACGACGTTVEEDDVGPAPEEIRRAVLAAGGSWRLLVDETGPGMVRALRVLRAALGLSLADASTLRRRIPGEVARGTRPEMERLLRLLAAEGVRAALDPVEPAPPPP